MASGIINVMDGAKLENIKGWKLLSLIKTIEGWFQSRTSLLDERGGFNQTGAPNFVFTGGNKTSDVF